MIGELDSDSPMPLYYQIYLRYKQLIQTGQLSKGERLPSESALEEAVGVSRITAKRAMDELANDGLVKRGRGQGTTVIHSAEATRVSADILGLVNTLVAIGESTDVELLAFDYVEAPEQIAEELGIEIGETVQRVERRRLKDGEPFSYILTFIPEDIGRTYSADNLASSPILALIEAAGHVIHEADQTVSALDAPPVIANHLRIPDNSALLYVKRVVRDGEGRIVQYIEVFYRPDMYQLHMNLTRVTPDKGREIWAARNQAASMD